MHLHLRVGETRDATPPPVFAGAPLLVIVLCRISVVPTPLNTPPPTPVAVLPVMVELVIVVPVNPNVVTLKMPPPWTAVFPLSVLRVMVRLPWLCEMPPPYVAVLPEIVLSTIVPP